MVLVLSISGSGIVAIAEASELGIKTGIQSDLGAGDQRRISRLFALRSLFPAL